MENLDTWFTKEEVTERTGISERTLERKIQSNEIRRQYRNVPGRKPLAIIHPDDVTKLETKTLKPVPAPRGNGANRAVIPTSRQNDMATMAAAFMAASFSPDKKFYLSLKEASGLSGLPQTYLRRKIAEGAIPAVKVPGWRIRRVDLERYNAASGEMAG